jgi:hypothetical protein
MAQELGKIEKPAAEEYLAGKKIFFVPLIFSSHELPVEYLEKCGRYWEQADAQIANLESGLGAVKTIFHELVADSGETGLKSLEQLKIGSSKLVSTRMQKGASLELTEDNDILTELMDWSRCLSLGLRNQKVFSTIYAAYTEANKKRYESISKIISEGLKENEVCIVILGENHRVQFPSDAQIFYVAPPALDETKRWLRDYEAKAQAEQQKGEQPDKEESPQEGG